MQRPDARRRARGGLRREDLEGCAVRRLALALRRALEPPPGR